jgi:UTP--glucose-1-phosphate uridylyltransferase
MVEKPQTKEEVLSLYSITDRVVLPPSIFEILERTQPGIGGEIQLTDAMKEIATTKGMTAVEMEGKRFDMGNKFGVLQANIEVGLVHPETKEQLKDYIKELAKSL